jgi:hypothetical protein
MGSYKSVAGAVLNRRMYYGAKFIVPDWGEIVDSGIGLSYKTASLNV